MALKGEPKRELIRTRTGWMEVNQTEKACSNCANKMGCFDIRKGFFTCPNYRRDYNC